MSKAAVPHRMRVAHPNEFHPKTIIFYPLESENKDEWADCFGLKAAAVYSAILGRDPDEVITAEKFLKCIACSIPPVKSALQALVAKVVRRATLQEERKEGVPSLESNIHGIILSMEDPKTLPEIVKETCDAIYLVAGFLKDFKQCGDDGMDKIDGYFMSKHGHHLVSDMVMLGNQLQLSSIFNVVQYLDQAVIEALRIVSKDAGSQSHSKLPFSKENFHEVVSLFCWYYSPFYIEKKRFRWHLAKELTTKSNLLECLHYCLVSPTRDDQVIVTTNLMWPIPTAKELVQSGVQFEVDPKGAIQIQFAEPVLKLPALVFNSKTETVVVNMIALERSKLKRPVTRYFQFMNELIDDPADVRILKRFGILRGKWKREEDVVDFVKRVDSMASYPSTYLAMDEEINKVKEYHGERMGKFLVRHGKAVKLATSVAAVSLVAVAVFAAKTRWG